MQTYCNPTVIPGCASGRGEAWTGCYNTYVRKNHCGNLVATTTANIFSETRNLMWWHNHTPRAFVPVNFEACGRRCMLVALVWLLSACPGTATAAIYYVSPTGNDRNVGTSWDTAWRTTKHAGNQAIAGDTVIIRKGSVLYDYLRIANSGRKDRPIVFRGESAADPPILTGATRVTHWVGPDQNGVWQATARSKTFLVVENDRPLPPASGPQCVDGRWHWTQGKLYYRPTAGTPDEHEVWFQSHGGGIAIGKHSWIVIEDMKCWIGGGACVQITGGSHNTIRRVHSKWNWRGVDITSGGNYNLLENVRVEQAREGIYIRNGSSHNIVRRCVVTHTGNPPLWTKNDRHAVAIGEQGGTVGNVVEDCEIAYSGGPPDSAALSCFRSPDTVFRNNYVHDNYASGLSVYKDSHGTIVEGNIVARNGEPAVRSGMKGITGLTVRNSRNVTVINNRVEGNFVSPDSQWPKHYLGPHGGLDIDATSQRIPMDMSGLRLENNVVTGTVGGPDIHISQRPNLSGTTIIPHSQAPEWLRLRDSLPAPRDNE